MIEWTVMHREDETTDLWRPVGIAGDRAKAESEMYDWLRDTNEPNNLCYGSRVVTDWQPRDPVLVDLVAEAMAGMPMNSLSAEEVEAWEANARAAIDVVRAADA